MTTTFIYALCEPGTRTVRYIGKANNPKERLRTHLQKSGSLKRDNKLGRWLRKVGEPTLVILREISVTDWKMAEERYIRLARGCGMDLVNSTDGGEGVHNPSLESRERSRASKLGAKNPWFGGLPPTTLAAATKANIGRIKSPAECENISRGLKGKPKSARHIANISGENHHMYGRTGGNNPNFGSKRSEETKLKMRKPRSEQAKANMRAGWVARKAKSV